LRIPSVRVATWARKRFDHQTDHQTLPVATRSERRSGPPIGEAGRQSEKPVARQGEPLHTSAQRPELSRPRRATSANHVRRSASAGSAAAAATLRPSRPSCGVRVTVSDREGAPLTSQTPSTTLMVTSRDQTAGPRTGNAESCGASARSIAAAASRSASAYTCA
jgi:hypothetical protein